MLIDRIRDDMQAAMKAQDVPRREALRFLLAEAKTAGINEKREPDDALVTAVIQKLAKQRRDGIEEFRKAGRQDLVAKDEAELAILVGYLPRQLSDDELEARVREIIRESGAASKKDMGKAMKLAVERLQGAADGKRIQQAVAKNLP
jgi:uncharacterized protein YqeY